MEALQINITLGLSPDALTAIKTLGGLFNGKVTVENEAAAAPAPTPAPAAKTETAAPAAKPASVAAPNAPAAEITDPMLSEAVQAAKLRSGAQSIRDLFAEFGIQSSIKCPAERRQELLDRLNTL